MTEDTLKSVEEFLADVERHGGGSPVILSRYGFKKIQLNGKYYLEPATKEEAEADLERLKEKGLVSSSARYGGCGYDGYAACYQDHKVCEGFCHVAFGLSAIGCVCD
jgi:hypothetical protein